MRSSLVMSLIGAASMAAALLVGCGDSDTKPTSSKVGESCVRTADCTDGLICVANVCYKSAPVTGGDAGATGVTPPVGPVLGGEGESCTSHVDCSEGLGCFNNRCTKTADTMGEAGAPGVAGIALGARGETCRVNGDCSKDLVCVPDLNASGTGVCDQANFGIAPTGLTCTGECLADADCCQLPVALHTPTIKSCEDIADAITLNAADCTAPVTPTAKALCFQQATYCECGAKTWTCNKETNACVYNTACVVANGADVPSGCPSYSRIRSLAALSCNPDSKKCVGATAVAGCTTDAKCEGKQVFDSTIADLCTAGECTCYSGNKQCYRKCARDIDCGSGQTCDTAKSHLCVGSSTCQTDTECAVSRGSLAFKCNAGTCAKSCASDRDCSGTGINGNPFTGEVCGADKFCASVVLDCTPETQCAPLTLGGLKPFCVPAITAPGTSVASSITD